MQIEYNSKLDAKRLTLTGSLSNNRCADKPFGIPGYFLPLEPARRAQDLKRNPFKLMNPVASP